MVSRMKPVNKCITCLVAPAERPIGDSDTATRRMKMPRIHPPAFASPGLYEFLLSSGRNGPCHSPPSKPRTASVLFTRFELGHALMSTKSQALEPRLYAQCDDPPREVLALRSTPPHGDPPARASEVCNARPRVCAVPPIFSRRAPTARSLTIPFPAGIEPPTDLRRIDERRPPRGRRPGLWRPPGRHRADFRAPNRTGLPLPKLLGGQDDLNGFVMASLQAVSVARKRISNASHNAVTSCPTFPRNRGGRCGRRDGGSPRR